MPHRERLEFFRRRNLSARTEWLEFGPRRVDHPWRGISEQHPKATFGKPSGIDPGAPAQFEDMAPRRQSPKERAAHGAALGFNAQPFVEAGIKGWGNRVECLGSRTKDSVASNTGR
jgi:hypothetical protein